MKLIVQPGEGIAPLIKAIDGAKKSVEILIFRCDRPELERALGQATKRGVSVTALIASINRGGTGGLRKLEMRLLAHGVTVIRTNDDLVKYHAKLLIIDRRVLYLLSFNFTQLDIDHSRGFALIITSTRIVAEGVKLFEADAKRRPFTPSGALVVSPLNSRAMLVKFIKDAKKQLLIYCADASDKDMIALLEDRAKKGVEVKLLGKVSKKNTTLDAHKLPMRLHARAIIRDRNAAFIGSQGLREIELDARREAGLIFRDAKIVKTLLAVYEKDWEGKEKSAPIVEEQGPDAGKVAKKVAKAFMKDLPSVGSALKDAFKEVTGESSNIDQEQLEETVKDVVKEAVRDAVNTIVQEAVDNNHANANK